MLVGTISEDSVSRVFQNLTNDILYTYLYTPETFPLVAFQTSRSSFLIRTISSSSFFVSLFVPNFLSSNGRISYLTFCWNFRCPFRENNFRLRAERFSNLVQTYFWFWLLWTADLAFYAMATCSSHWTDIIAMGWTLNPWGVFFDFWTSFLS